MRAFGQTSGKRKASAQAARQSKAAEANASSPSLASGTQYARVEPCNPFINIDYAVIRDLRCVLGAIETYCIKNSCGPHKMHGVFWAWQRLALRRSSFRGRTTGALALMQDRAQALVASCAVKLQQRGVERLGLQASGGPTGYIKAGSNTFVVCSLMFDVATQMLPHWRKLCLWQAQRFLAPY